MTDWHADGPLLARYAAGDIGHVTASSLEAHLVACERCRAKLAGAGAVGPDRLERLWAGVADMVDQPRRRLGERALVRLGLRDHTARLLAATPSLRVSWMVALAASIGLAVLAVSDGPRQSALFLLLAPVLPLAGVAAAYGPGADPAHELAATSPTGLFRLLVVRASAVIAVTVVLTGAASLALPLPAERAAAWLLPALALSVGTMALSSFVDPVRAAASFVVGWAVVVTVTGRLAAPEAASLADAVLASFVFRTTGQLACLLALAASGLVLILRRESLDLQRMRSVR